MARQFSIDRVFALLLLPVILPILAGLYLIVVLAQGRPFLFASERMRGPDASFKLLKIRTMNMSDGAELMALGGNLRARVTPLGAVLRRTRLDELPQIFNVLKGDIRFIGPRPPLRRYVEDYPEVYGRILARTPPGITGLATVMLHGREERLLANCRTAEETDEVYRRRCLPVKARLDLIYCERRSLGLNLIILWRTFSRLGIFNKASDSIQPVEAGTVVWLRPLPKRLGIAPTQGEDIWSDAASVEQVAA